MLKILLKKRTNMASNGRFNNILSKKKWLILLILILVKEDTKDLELKSFWQKELIFLFTRGLDIGEQWDTGG